MDAGSGATGSHPDDRDRVVAVDQETNRTGRPFVAEYRFLKADGTYLWIHDESTLVRRPDGSGFWQGFMLDITERKEAEDRLAETEERFRLLVERARLSDLRRRRSTRRRADR